MEPSGIKKVGTEKNVDLKIKPKKLPKIISKSAPKFISKDKSKEEIKNKDLEEHKLNYQNKIKEIEKELENQRNINNKNTSILK